MNIPEEMDEKLREVCCIGQLDSVFKLLSDGAQVNSQNKINGWTCLHWAAKRGHTSIIPVLLHSGADLNIKNHKGETAYDVAFDEEIRELLTEGNNNDAISNNDAEITDVQANFRPISSTSTNFIPNYLRDPVFPYMANNISNSGASRSAFTNSQNQQEPVKNIAPMKPIQFLNSDAEIVLKVRVANISDTDFIEVELLKTELTYESLLTTCCRETNVDVEKLVKIRKLPNTIIRKDKDVKRLVDFQEIELVLSS